LLRNGCGHVCRRVEGDIVGFHEHPGGMLGLLGVAQGLDDEGLERGAECPCHLQADQDAPPTHADNQHIGTGVGLQRCG
jgi:hypothetical protein